MNTDNKNKIILDLCGGTGSWSKPYKDAGYDVHIITLPEQNVLTYKPPKNVYGILAAPPCTMFSMVRTTAKTPRDFNQGMETVEACLRIIWECRKQGSLKFWALENPKGYLRQFLGYPPFNFDPYEFGASYNKSTDIWGYFKKPLPTRKKEKAVSIALSNAPFEKIPDNYIRDPNMRKDAIQRSITPSGFAKAFYKANR